MYAEFQKELQDQKNTFYRALNIEGAGAPIEKQILDKLNYKIKEYEKKLIEKVDESTKAVKVMDERLNTMEKTLKMWLSL